MFAICLCNLKSTLNMGEQFFISTLRDVPIVVHLL